MISIMSLKKNENKNNVDICDVFMLMGWTSWAIKTQNPFLYDDMYICMYTLEAICSTEAIYWLVFLVEN